jgi:competence protein ComEC
MFTRQVNIYNTIFASAFILLMLNPYSIMNVGFQLSYIAVLSIVFFQPKIYSLLAFRNRVTDYFWQLISVAIAAQIGTFPITIYYFDQFPLYFILTNIVIIPLATLIIYGAILMFIFSFSNSITIIISKSLILVTKLLNKNVNLIERLPFSKIDEFNIDAYKLSILVIIIFFILFFIISKNLKFLKYSIWVFIGLLIYNLSLNHAKSKQTIFTVHNIPNKSAINIIENKNAFFIYNDEFENDNKNIKYNISPLWKEYGISQNKIKLKKTDKLINYFAVSNKKIALLKNDSIANFKTNHKLKLDYIILSENIDIKVSDLNNYFEFKKVIFDSSNSIYKIKYWEKECVQNNICFYNVLNSGAYVEYL